MNSFLLTGGRVVLVAALLSLMWACAPMQASDNESLAGAGSDAMTQTEQAIAAAEQAYVDINKRGGAWAYTGDILDEAKQAVKNREFDKALQLAKQAHDQAIMASKQFEGQVNAAPYLF